MVELELAYLREIDRLTIDGAVVVAYLRDQLGMRADGTPFTDVIEVAATLSWTRDPFDRVIAAQALVADARLVTRDATIRSNLPSAVW